MTDEYQFTNNAVSTLAVDMGSGDATATVASGDGGLFPSVGAGDGEAFDILIIQGSTSEWMTVTARSSDILTVTRPDPQTFTAGATVSLRVNATILATFIQKGVYREYAGSPDGLLAAAYSGEEVLDTDNDKWYKHTTGTEWKVMSGT